MPHPVEKTTNIGILTQLFLVLLIAIVGHWINNHGDMMDGVFLISTVLFAVLTYDLIYPLYYELVN